MKKTWLLFQIQLKSRLRPQRGGSQGGSPVKSSLGRVGIGIAILFSLASIGYLYIALFDGLIDASIEVLDMPSLAIDVAVVGAMLQAVLFGLFFVFGELFLSTDGAFLSSLPLSGRQVFTAKFFYLYLIHLALSALLFVPPVVLYALKVGGGVVFFLKALYVLLLLPVFPLLLSVVLSFVLMLLMLPVRKKEIVFTFGTILFVLAIVLMQFWFTAQMTAAEDLGQNWFNGFLEQHFGAIRSITQPPASWASAAVTGSPSVSAFSLILYTLTALLALWAVLSLAGLLYRRFAVVSTETAPAKRQKSRRQGDTRPKSPVAALFAKEWRSLLRSTIYATNSLMTGPLILVFLLLPALQNKGAFAELTAAMAGLEPGLAGLAIAAVMALPSTMNIGAFTVFSREGSGFWQLKTLPVSAGTLMRAKVLFGVSVNLVHIVPVFLAAIFVFRFSVGAACLGLLLGMALSVAGTAAGMLLDARRPKLSWVNEAEAIKQNLNGMLGMLLSAVVSGLVAAGAAFLLFGAGLPAGLVALAVFLVSFAISVLLYLALVKTAQTTWPTIDA